MTWERIAESRAADSNGRAEVVLPQVPWGAAYLVERLSVSQTGDRVRIYAGALAGDALMDETDPTTAPANIADESSPIRLREGESLIALFTGAAADEVCRVVAQVEVIDEAAARAAAAKSGRARRAVQSSGGW